jgi:DNA-binding SARP family transcriptional activator
VLARLALDAGKAVSADRLIDELWAADGQTDRNTLQSKISQLRRALGDASVITGSRAGYLLNIAPNAVDALRVAGMAEQVRTLRGSGDLQAVDVTCSAALELFRGELLAESADAWLDPYRARLEQVRFGLIEEQLAARLELGGSTELIADLESLVAGAPLRERGWLLLITALYRAGRQADALAAFRRVREMLDEELGLAPGPELQRLEQQILRHDPVLETSPAAVGPGVAGPGVAPVTGNLPGVAGPGFAPVSGNLPGLWSQLIGREIDIDAVRALLLEHRLVTIVGRPESARRGWPLRWRGSSQQPRVPGWSGWKASGRPRHWPNTPRSR